ncbi:MAG: DNA polymerase III subunit gamma/tau [Sphingomonadales bacterium]|nr:DNA polymerase III subunit gamma/tau [Sphingomonadales bacterium]
MSDSPADPGFDLGEPPAPPKQTAYRVLARAYRPQTFAELIGQEAMVRTLANAIRRDRLPHAFLMTGVRGVGKTSTARLIAKALNCVGPDGQGGPTIDPCGVCEPCRAIADGRHIDVVEMDAASHTGVDDVREIIEAVRYAAVSARFKIYIIDEVHMLSRNAFNALLKTLEEPPEHVKFLFATTEVNKVPITVLSRCQRFDLRRIPVELLVENFRMICGKEGVEAEEDALRLIATAAEGSARDGQSILDQAIAHAETVDGRPYVRADQVREMLGLSDRGATRRLFGQILDGDAPALLATLAEQESLGVEPVATVNALLELIHGVTTAKAGRGAGLDRLAEAERAAVAGWAEELSFPVRHRLWQLLLKGHAEVVAAARPHAACEMALLRLVHAASMPDPLELARMIREGGAGSPAPALASGGGASMPFASAPAPMLQSPVEPEAPVAAFPEDFRALVQIVRTKFATMAYDLENDHGLVRYEPPLLVLKPPRPIDLRQLTDAINKATGQLWTVELSDGPAEPTLYEQDQAARKAREDAMRATPIVAAALEAFPGATFVEPDSN